MGIELDDNDGPRLSTILKFEGSFVAEHAHQLVGTIGAYELELTTPGGNTTVAAGTTLAGVLPTHRRQGIFRQLMTAHLDWARSTGKSCAGLWASEASIYRKMGFGPTTQHGIWTIEAKRAHPRLAPPHEIELVPLKTAIPRLLTVYEARRRDRAGMLARSISWWNARQLRDTEQARDGASELKVVFAQRDNRDQGYVLFRRMALWPNSLPAHEVQIVELMGDAPARHALWHFLLSIDLVEKVSVFNLPIDDELPHLLDDSRRAALLPRDGLWLKLIDIPHMLQQRSYDIDGTYTIWVQNNELNPQSQRAQTLTLVVKDGLAQVESSRKPAEIIIHETDLASILWGDVSPITLLGAGRLKGDLQRIHSFARLLQTPLHPWCPERF